jgi:hypothetical protein
MTQNPPKRLGIDIAVHANAVPAAQDDLDQAGAPCWGYRRRGRVRDGRDLDRH